MDSVCFVQSAAQAEVANEIVFNAAFAASNPAAYFRGPNGGRMPWFVVADAAGPGASGTGTKALVDFSRGSVDIQVDKLLMGRDRTNSSDNASAEAVMTIAKGTLDANLAILGDQDNGNNLNPGGAGTPTGYARGTMNVATNALFTINDTLVLGYTTADLTNNRAADQGFGRLSITESGVVRANAITCGGVTKLTTISAGQNTITMAGNGNLIVTNAIGAPDAKLGTLTMNGGNAKLSLVSVSVASTNVHVKILAGTGGIIELRSIPGPGTYPLISYEGASAGLSLVLPAGFFGFIDNDTADGLIRAVVSTNPPNHLIWRGDLSSTWDTSTLNWLDGSSLAATNFNQGDAVLFDDSASNSTVSISGTMIPAGGTTISNTLLNYTFSGGTIAGLGATVKKGNGALTMQAIHNPPLTISNGTFMVDSSGILNGGLNFFASTILSNVGSINGPISLQAGALVNVGTLATAPGLMTIGTGVFITNYTTMNMGGGTWAVPAGSTIVNFGTINNLAGRLNVNGTFLGAGTVHDGTGVPTSGTDGRLAINSGATLSVGSSIGTLSVEGRFDASAGGNIIVEVDFNNPQTNDLLAIDYAGNMQARFTMTNINPGAGTFANGQSFVIMRGNFGVTLTNAAAAHVPVVFPNSPGPGLSWDVSGMRITNTLRTIGVIPVQTTNRPVITSTILGGTNMSLTWSSLNYGYVLQAQTNNLNVGIGGNWFPVPGSEQTNRIDMPIDPANPAVFFRLSNQ
jgi:hypothetical protein